MSKLPELHAVIQQSPWPIDIFSGSDHIISILHSETQELFPGMSVLGHSARELMKKRCNGDFIGMLDEVYASGRRSFTTESRGERIHHISCQPWRGLDGRISGVLTFSQDATELLRTQQLLQGLRGECAARDRLVSSVVHDLRTPLALARVSADLLMRNQMDAESRIKLLRIERAIGRMDRMIKDLLDASHLREKGTIPLRTEPCDLAEVVREATVDLVSIYRDRIKLDVATEALGRWDRQAIRRLLENLVNNACKFGSPGSPIEIALKKSSEKVLLSVRNHGDPMDPKVCEAILEGMDPAGIQSSPQCGWGLGLKIVRAIAQGHGGVVRLCSSKESGTLFTLEFPCMEEERIESPLCVND